MTPMDEQKKTPTSRYVDDDIVSVSAAVTAVVSDSSLTDSIGRPLDRGDVGSRHRARQEERTSGAGEGIPAVSVCRFGRRSVDIYVEGTSEIVLCSGQHEQHVLDGFDHLWHLA